MKPFRLNFDAAEPIYEQIIRGIGTALVRGELRSGERLPSQRELAVTLRVNPNTVQHAYREMEREGLVVTRRGLGTFLTDDLTVLERLRQHFVGEAVDRFIADLTSLGFSSSEMLTRLQDRLHTEDESGRPHLRRGQGREKDDED